MVKTSGDNGDEPGKGSQAGESENLPCRQRLALDTPPSQTGTQMGAVRVAQGGGAGEKDVAAPSVTENGTNTPSTRTCICGLCAGIEKLRRAGTWLPFL